MSLNRRCARPCRKGFQRSEFLVEHGAVDMIVDRREMRDRLATLLTMLTRQPAPKENAE